jgi:hypothetical protein
LGLGARLLGLRFLLLESSRLGSLASSSLVLEFSRDWRLEVVADSE